MSARSRRERKGPASVDDVRREEQHKQRYGEKTLHEGSAIGFIYRILRYVLGFMR